VQHLESLNGTVGAITGVRVHETVPDVVLDEAEEVVLVDATPDELTARLAAGKVYVPQQAERAAQNFFRKGNLIALREIALRRTAEHVEDDVRGWRVEQSSSQPGAGLAEQLQAWNTSGAILACIGPGDNADQTVRTAARLAGQLNVRWHAAYVETSRLRGMPEAGRNHVLAVLKLAEELGAATSVLTGEAGDRTDDDRPRARWPGYALAAASSVLITLMAMPLAHVLEGTNIVMLFLLGVVGVALRFGRGPAAFAALLNVAAFDFFFVDPRLSFSVSDWQYLLTFAVMTAVGLLIGQLTAGLRFAAGVSASRERRAHSLFELTRELSAALQTEQVV
ncbi:MAG: DUF4118 domain-containing protein, partial [Variovorax sp.]